VLIATNPFARVDSLYVPGMVQVYAGKQRATQAPHLFAIAEEAFMYGLLPHLQTLRVKPGPLLMIPQGHVAR
jgi:myosin heavy subunit